jgi:CheY-like chemotaxis protein
MGTAIVIDDDVFFCNLLTDILEDLNLNVVSYKSPEEFFSSLTPDTAAASLGGADFILTDNRMPGMTGLEFLTKLKEMGCPLPADRTAIISGYWDDYEMRQAEELGCQVFDKYNSPEKLGNWISQRQSNTLH